MLRSTKAFTLIELLIVILILTILTVLMLPALSQSRESARQTRCVINLNQITKAQYAYRASYNGMFAHSWETLGLLDNPILICPSDRSGNTCSYILSTYYLRNMRGIMMWQTIDSERLAKIQVARDVIPFHMGKVNTVYLDGKVR